MSVKNILLSGVLLCGSVVVAVNIQDRYLCNLSQLRALEAQKLEKFVDGFGNNSSNTRFDSELRAADLQMQKLLMRCMGLYEKYQDSVDAIIDISEQISYEDLSVEDGIGELKEVLKELLDQVQQDPELTNLVKNFVGFGSKQFFLLIDRVITSPYWAKIMGELSGEEIDEIFSTDVVPRDIDVVQIAIEYITWSHGYFKKQLDAKRVLTTDDLCYVLKELGVAYKLPKKAQDFWNEFITAMQKGLKDLPQDVRNEIVQPIENVMRKSELEIGMKLLTSLAKLRREIVNTKGADQGKLIGYGKLLDQCIAQIHKISNQNTVNKDITQKGLAAKFILLEKLMFTK